MSASRRQFIRRTCCTAAALGVASSFSRFGLINALAQATGQYRALVCIFLFGGNDANNMIVPYDSVGYANYQKIRGAAASGGLALDQSTLLPITTKTEQASTGSNLFGLHPQLTDLQNLFNSNQLAFLANVGTLSQPMTKTQYQQKLVSVPANLFSHSDQQEEWQTLALDGFAKTGWAGRMADKLQTLNASSSFPPITSVAGTAIFCTGQQTEPFAIIPSATGSTAQGLQDNAPSARLTALNQLLTFDTGLSLVQSASAVTTNALTDSSVISQALASAARAGNQISHNEQLAGAAAAAGGQTASDSQHTRANAADLFLFAWRLRHAQQPDRHARYPLLATGSGRCRVLPGDAGAGPRPAGHHVHAFRFQPNFPAGFRRRDGPCMGQRAVDDGRRSAGRRHLRKIAAVHAGRSR